MLKRETKKERRREQGTEKKGEENKNKFDQWI